MESYSQEARWLQLGTLIRRVPHSDAMAREAGALSTIWQCCHKITWSGGEVLRTVAATLRNIGAADSFELMAETQLVALI